MHANDNAGALRTAIACLLALALVACAATRIDADWADPQFVGKKLTGSKVYVSCQALASAVQMVCVDQLSARLKALGAVPLSMPPVASNGSMPELPTVGRALAEARGAGAAALLSVSVSPDATAVSSAPSFSIGLGGFSGGSRGGGVGFGVGVPVGGIGSVSTGYAASASLTDLRSGKLMWTARASAPPSDNVDEQLGLLADALLGSAHNAGLW